MKSRPLGIFMGHAMPAVFFAGFGAFFLVHTAVRLRRHARNAAGGGSKLQEKPAAVNYTSSALVPETPYVLRRVGLALMFCTTIGIVIEAISGISDGLSFYHQLAHQALYICLFLVGACAIVESNGLLFPDVARCALAVSFLLQYVLWREHALMKTEEIEIRIHIIQAEINLAMAALFGYSFHNPRSLAAYILSWSVLTLNGMWLFTCGLIQSGYCGILLHTIGAVLVLEAAALGAIIGAAAVFFLPPASFEVPSGDGKEAYSTVATTEDTLTLELS